MIIRLVSIHARGREYAAHIGIRHAKARHLRRNLYHMYAKSGECSAKTLERARPLDLIQALYLSLFPRVLPRLISLVTPVRLVMVRVFATAPGAVLGPVGAIGALRA